MRPPPRLPLVAAALLAAALPAGCDPEPAADDDSAAPDPGLAFPAGFLFGTAIAGFQSDMGCPTLGREACDDPASDWFAFTTSPETVSSGGAYLSGQDPGVVGPGFRELWREDIGRASGELANNALRLSIEWSRIFPEPTDGAADFEALSALADPVEVAWYHEVFQEVRAQGMEPLVTLNHYSLPTWIHDPVGCHQDLDACSPRGWVDRDRTLAEIARYAAFCAREFGAEVDLWVTLNEPLQNAVFGYLLPGEFRSHPPAVTIQQEAARVVVDALIDAHARMYDAVKAEDTADADGDGEASSVGVVYPLTPIVPADPEDPLDQQAAANVHYLWNRAYLDAVALGEWDAGLDGVKTHREDLAGRMDFVGVNWYFSLLVSGLEDSILPDFSPLLTINPFEFGYGENLPEALAEQLRYVNEDLGLPVIITENGTPDPQDDGTAPAYLVENLLALQSAIAGGADVRGYFYWTLTDNFEWNHGMDVRMGLYAVDGDDPQKTRTARQAAGIYAEIAASGEIPEEYANP